MGRWDEMQWQQQQQHDRHPQQQQQQQKMNKVHKNISIRNKNNINTNDIQKVHNNNSISSSNNNSNFNHAGDRKWEKPRRGSNNDDEKINR